VREGEIRALGEIAGKSIARPSAVARDVHHAVTSRVFGALGPLGMPVRMLHDPVSSASYKAVAAALRAPLAAGGRALARGAAQTSSSLAESPAGALALGAANGVFGDRLARDHPELAVPLGFWRAGRRVRLDEAGIADAFADATPRLAVFVHGLCETEAAWRVPYPGGPARPTYGARLRSDLGITPVYVRYNTGLHVSDNGRALAARLDELLAGWPTEVEGIVLVGHSMGGLVARSAGRYAELEDRQYTSRISHVICLGTPHLGAPLEKAANVASWPLGRLPETRPFADLFVNGRSAGIKDLRFGSCLEEDWCDCDPDEFLRDRCCECPFLESATYCFVAATLATKPSGAGGMVGDLLVTYRSASGGGRRRRIPFEAQHGSHVGGVDHLRLLNHPAVYERIRGWVAQEPVRRLPATARSRPV
jgi:pimeloyl-ACP methyl ester carboxylesterase